MNKKLFNTGLIGTVIAALCCFTPILVILLGAIGLSAIVGWLDFILLPALGIFLLLLSMLLSQKAQVNMRFKKQQTSFNRRLPVHDVGVKKCGCEKLKH